MRTILRIILAALLLELGAGAAAAQTTAIHVPNVTSLPASCRTGDLVYKTTATTGLYNCTATNTWGAAGGGTGVSTIEEESTPLTARATLNFIGGTVTCVDNGGSTRTDCSVKPTVTFGIVVDGAGVTLTTGVKGYIRIPFACTIVRATVLSIDGSASNGDIVFDVWKDTYANYPPDVMDTITASAKPTLTAANKSTDTTLTGWTTSVASGDVVAFRIDSVTSLTKVLLELEATVN